MSNRLTVKKHQAGMRSIRVRKSLTSSSNRPRLSVKITNLHVTAQIIDDTKNHTIAYITSAASSVKGSMSEKAAWVGEEIAKKAKAKKVKKVAFDRGSKLYHGRIKALAEAARKNGLEF